MVKIKDIIIRLFIILVFGVAIGTLIFWATDKDNQLENENNNIYEKAIETTKEYKETLPYNDEYDFYTYEITNINGDTIEGIGLDIEGSLILSKEYNNVEFEIGDIITVVFESGIHDKILDILKFYIFSDGTTKLKSVYY